MSANYNLKRVTVQQFFREFSFLLILVLTSLLVFSLLTQWLSSLLFHVNIGSFGSPDYIFSKQDINALKFSQAFLMLGIFGIPAFAMSIYLKNQQAGILGLKKGINWLIVGQVTLAFILIIPFNEWLIDFNESISLPEFMGSIEAWMRQKEIQMATQIEMILKMPNYTQLFICIIVIAVLPAFLEELFFRGLIQSLLVRWIGKSQLSIWLTAIFFSAIHLQFFGFLPRLVLGLVLGYLFFWTKSLWPSIYFHFLNNIVNVLYFYFIQHGIISEQTGKKFMESNVVTVICFAVAAAFFFFLAIYYSKKRDKKKDWVVVYTTENQLEAEVIKTKLENEEIDAVVINKRDSSYTVFGKIEVFVNPDSQQRAIEIINTTYNEEQATD